MPKDEPARGVTAYIGLGSNLGDREGNIRRAVELLVEAEGVRVVRVSSLVETAPVGYEDQPEFVNAAAAVSTTLAPRELLSVCQEIEQRLGRVRTIRWGPRTIDMDILLFGGMVIDEEDLKVPHPLMHERLFVLVPLCEIAKDAYHPVLLKTACELLEEARQGLGFGG